MQCPFCQKSPTKVVDSRDVDNSRAIRRRRECEKCKKRFTTYEEMESLRLIVIKRDGRRQEYNREKILQGLERAVEKRPLSKEQIEKMLNEIEYALHAKHVKELSSREIGRMIMEGLKKLDEVAYIRFASVYKGFGSLSSFKKELDKFTD